MKLCVNHLQSPSTASGGCESGQVATLQRGWDPSFDRCHPCFSSSITVLKKNILNSIS